MPESNEATMFFNESLAFDAGSEPPVAPISFLYGGEPAGEVLATWDRSVDEDGRRRTVSYDDPGSGLKIDCVITTFEDVPAVDWVCYLENTGRTDTPIIEQFLVLDGPLLHGATDATLRWSNGDANSHDAFLPHTEPLENAKRFTPTGGRPSNGVFPFFNLFNADGGWIMAVGWTGQWMAEFVPEERGSVTVRAGMETTRFRLEPGERVRTPRIVLLRWTGDNLIDGHNLFRRLMADHYLPRRDGEPAYPPIAHNTAATIYQTGQPTNETNQLEMVEATAQRGCEAFWLDAYWYPQPWHEHVGDWFPRPDDFPNGLKPVSDAIHERGMRFVLWFEPERVAPGTQWDDGHPEYLLRLPDTANRLVNLGDPEARAFVTDFLDGRIREWDVDVYRQDFNMDPLAYWQANDSEDRQGITEMKYVEGLYRLWDELVERNPALTIDNCASGGRRIDLETCSRSYPLWRSDYNDIGQGLEEGNWPNMGRADQVHVAGLNLYLPFHTGPVWDERPYIWRSAMAAGIVLYGNVEGFDRDRSAAAVAELKSLRPFFLGDFYPLTEVTTSQERWHAYQLDRPDLAAGCALIFRRPECAGQTIEVELEGIAQTAAYEVSITGETYRHGPWQDMPGAELERLAVAIPEQPGSALVRYRRK